MSDTPPNDPHDPDDPQEPNGPRELREARDRAVQRAQEAEQRATDAEKLARENVMLRAGVDLDSKLGGMFSRSYEGDLDIDKVKAEWAELAPAQPAPDESTADTPSAADIEAQRQRAALASDPVAPTQLTDEHPMKAGLKEYHRLREEDGLTSDEAAVQVVDKVLTAALKGDPRVLWDEAAKERFYARVPGRS